MRDECRITECKWHRFASVSVIQGTVLEISGSNFKRSSRKKKWYRLILLIQFSPALNGHHDDSVGITLFKGIQDSLVSV